MPKDTEYSKVSLKDFVQEFLKKKTLDQDLESCKTGLIESSPRKLLDELLGLPQDVIKHYNNSILCIVDVMIKGNPLLFKGDPELVTDYINLIDKITDNAHSTMKASSVWTLLGIIRLAPDAATSVIKVLDKLKNDSGITTKSSVALVLSDIIKANNELMRSSMEILLKLSDDITPGMKSNLAYALHNIVRENLQLIKDNSEFGKTAFNLIAKCSYHLTDNAKYSAVGTIDKLVKDNPELGSEAIVLLSRLSASEDKHVKSSIVSALVSVVSADPVLVVPAMLILKDISNDITVLSVVCAIHNMLRANPELVTHNSEFSKASVAILLNLDSVEDPSLKAITINILSHIVKVHPELGFYAAAILNKFSGDQTGYLKLPSTSLLSTIVEADPTLMTHDVGLAKLVITLTSRLTHNEIILIKPDVATALLNGVKENLEMIHYNPELAKAVMCMLNGFSVHKSEDIKTTVAWTLHDLVKVNPGLAEPAMEIFSKMSEDKSQPLQNPIAWGLSAVAKANPKLTEEAIILIGKLNIDHSVAWATRDIVIDNLDEIKASTVLIEKVIAIIDKISNAPDPGVRASGIWTLCSIMKIAPEFGTQAIDLLDKLSTNSTEYVGSGVAYALNIIINSNSDVAGRAKTILDNLGDHEIPSESIVSWYLLDLLIQAKSAPEPEVSDVVKQTTVEVAKYDTPWQEMGVCVELGLQITANISVALEEVTFISVGFDVDSHVKAANTVVPGDETSSSEMERSIEAESERSCATFARMRISSPKQCPVTPVDIKDWLSETQTTDADSVMFIGHSILDGFDSD